MLTTAPVSATLPSTDLQRTKEFYAGKLGLTIVKETDGGVLFGAGENTKIYLYKRGPSKADHTLASFLVKDLEETIAELTQAGIVFEQYDFPGLKTDEKGIAVSKEEDEKAAWFKDPDGNILAVGQEL